MAKRRSQRKPRLRDRRVGQSPYARYAKAPYQYARMVGVPTSVRNEILARTRALIQRRTA